MAGFCDPELLRQMTRVITHRGPDDEGYYEEASVGLGHRRLSIIDLSTGHQPITSYDDEAVIVYNGEIYNYLELRDELERAGVRFRTHTDTEVIVNLYRKEGARCVERLNGIFAFAIWEPRAKRLFLARDQLGVKPLLYLERDGVLLFASEAKSILQWSGYKPEVAPEALRQSLVYSFVPGDETLLAGIRKLPPGHVMVFENGASHISPYWTLDAEPQPERDEAWYAARLLELLTDSVRGQLVSDVPLGATLSGGLDSSAVVALMSRVSDRPVQTFSIGFGGRRDELSYARIVADKFKTDHREFIVDPGRFTDILPRVLWHLEEPILSSILPTWYLGEAARKIVTVILIGEGSDEIFAGYRRFRPVGSFARALVPYAAKRWFYFWHFSSLGGRRGDAIFSDAFQRRLAATDPVEAYFGPAARGGRGDALNRLLRYEQRYELADFQLLRIDRLTMAHSVEARVPYLDPRLVRFSNQMPSRYKLKGNSEKHVLRLAMRDILPPEILERRKQGLGTPLIPWFKAGMYDIARDLLSPANLRARGYFEAREVDRLFDSSRNNLLHREDLGKLFKLVMFELWHRLFIDGGEGAAREPGLPEQRQQPAPQGVG
ncbi:MAG: asparagine synthase (glutamine-hydrolyzing) [Acidobacteria bacterium]|nr:asparagine synthase (glutamine-hydrolyzing) [Acidobacteriota bacterium]